MYDDNLQAVDHVILRHCLRHHRSQSSKPNRELHVLERIQGGVQWWEWSAMRGCQLIAHNAVWYGQSPEMQMFQSSEQYPEGPHRHLVHEVQQRSGIDALAVREHKGMGSVLQGASGFYVRRRWSFLILNLTNVNLTCCY